MLAVLRHITMTPRSYSYLFWIGTYITSTDATLTHTKSWAYCRIIVHPAGILIEYHGDWRVSLTLALVAIPISITVTYSTLQIPMQRATSRIPFVTLKQQKIWQQRVILHSQKQIPKTNFFIKPLLVPTSSNRAGWFSNNIYTCIWEVSSSNLMSSHVHGYCRL
jgi:hypothetical protein